MHVFLTSHLIVTYVKYEQMRQYENSKFNDNIRTWVDSINI